jgi:hypothetical protein
MSEVGVSANGQQEIVTKMVELFPILAHSFNSPCYIIQASARDTSS